MNKNGFTLVELLVVISIIAVLSAVGLVLFSSIQSRARDSIRKNDLRALATALEIYYQKNNQYVVGNTVGNTNCSDLAGSGLTSFMTGDIPKDPKGTVYCYLSDDVAQTYTLCANLDIGDSSSEASCPLGYNFGIKPK